MSVNAVNPSTGELSRVAGGTLYADMPIASVVEYAGSTPPNGFLACDGSTITQSVYPELYAIIGGTLPSKSGYIIKAKQVAVPFDVAEYVRNQNVLSEYEDITLPTTEATAITMQYDGFLVISQVYSSSMSILVYINGINITRAGGNNLTLAQSVLFKKGDSIYATKIGGGIVEKVAYYKLRDYTGR